MQSSRRIQRIAQKIASKHPELDRMVTYKVKDKTDVINLGFWEDIDKDEYEKHLKEVFGSNWRSGEIVKIEGIPLPNNGKGTSIDDLYMMLEFENNWGDEALQAGLSLGYRPSELEEKYLGYHKSFMEFMEWFYDRYPPSTGPYCRLMDWEDKEKYVEENAVYVQNSKGEIFAFWEE